jgi:hypothetical protein
MLLFHKFGRLLSIVNFLTNQWELSFLFKPLSCIESVTLREDFQFPNLPIIYLGSYLLDIEFKPLLLPIVRLLQHPQTFANPSKGFDFLAFTEFCLLFVRICCRQPLSSFESYGFLMISHG